MRFVFCMITGFIAAVSAETTGVSFAVSSGLYGSGVQSLDEFHNVKILGFVVVTTITIMAVPTSALPCSRC